MVEIGRDMQKVMVVRLGFANYTCYIAGKSAVGGHPRAPPEPWNGNRRPCGGGSMALHHSSLHCNPALGSTALSSQILLHRILSCYQYYSSSSLFFSCHLLHALVPKVYSNGLLRHRPLLLPLPLPPQSCSSISSFLELCLVPFCRKRVEGGAVDMRN